MSKRNILDPKPLTQSEPAVETPQASTPPEPPPTAETPKEPAEGDAPTPAGPFNPAQPPANPEPLKKLPEGWRQFSVEGLSALCKRSGLPSSGIRTVLVKRLEVKFFGVSMRQVNGRMKCRYCDAQARPNGVRKLNEEGTIVERYYKCCGKRSHTFHFQETIEPDPAAADASASTATNLQRFRKRETYL